MNGEKFLYTLDCTTDITYSLPSNISSFPVEGGSNVSENIVLQNRTLNFSGYITDIKTINSGNIHSTKEHIEALEYVRDNKILFTASFGKELPLLENCFFQDLTISQDITTGSVVNKEKNINSYKVDISLKQLRVIKRAGEGVIRASEIVDPTQTQKDVSGSTSFADERFSKEDYFTEGRNLALTGQKNIQEAVWGQ